MRGNDIEVIVSTVVVVEIDGALKAFSVVIEATEVTVDGITSCVVAENPGSMIFPPIAS